MPYGVHLKTFSTDKSDIIYVFLYKLIYGNTLQNVI